MKSQDILILLKLVSLQQQNSDTAELKEQTSVRALAAAVGVGKTEVNSSINRSINAGLALKDRKHSYPKANSNALLEFICHGIKYVFPVKPAELVRGVPTAFDAPVLAGELHSVRDLQCVWPSPTGEIHGQAVTPLFKSVPQAVAEDSLLYTYLALVDAIRIGNPRESALACKLLKQRLKP